MCSLCDRAFNDSSALRIHQLTHVEGKFVCEDLNCDKIFTTASALRLKKIKINFYNHNSKIKYRIEHLEMICYYLDIS